MARLVGGLSAGMAYPTTLALITALWAPGASRTKAIAMWSAIGGGFSALGPLASGFLLEHFWWGSVFLLTLPLAALALVLAMRFLPAHVNESTDPVDNLGGVLSMLDRRRCSCSASTSCRSPTSVAAVAVILVGAAAVFGALFYLRQRRATIPAVRPRRRRPPAVLGGRARRDHRVRLVDGRDVHRPAVPPERARLRHARSRCGDPPRRVHDGPRRATVGQARAVARDRGSPCCSATASVCSGSSRCSSCGTRASATGRWRWRTR